MVKLSGKPVTPLYLKNSVANRFGLCNHLFPSPKYLHDSICIKRFNLCTLYGRSHVAKMTSDEIVNEHFGMTTFGRIFKAKPF